MYVTDDDVDDFLAHYGKLGMKWGTRRAASRQNRSLNKASRAKDRAKFDTSIDKARDRVKSGATKATYAKAKDQYKRDKVKVGSREAKKVLYKAQAKQYNEINTSRAAKPTIKTWPSCCCGDNVCCCHY